MTTRLSPDQALSGTWLVIKEYANERLRELRARLEGDLSDKDTIAVRAQIRELKKLLDIENPEQEILE